MNFTYKTIFFILLLLWAINNISNDKKYNKGINYKHINKLEKINKTLKKENIRLKNNNKDLKKINDYLKNNNIELKIQNGNIKTNNKVLEKFQNLAGSSMYGELQTGITEEVSSQIEKQINRELSQLQEQNSNNTKCDKNSLITTDYYIQQCR